MPHFLLCQNENEGNRKTWDVFAGYAQPGGRWTNKVDFYDENGYGAPVYYSSFAGQTGLHMKAGFSAGLCCDKIYFKKNGNRRIFEMLFNPCVVDLLFYDLKSNGPAISSSRIQPLMQLETSFAPCFNTKINEKSNIKGFVRLGCSFKRTSGEVHYERSNFAYPIYYPVYTGNDFYIDKSNYSYNGIGVTFAPGLKYVWGKFGLGAELHYEFSTGTYKGIAFFNDYYGNPRTNVQNIPRTVFGDKFLNVFFSYSFEAKK